jgi:O-antigen ligase
MFKYAPFQLSSERSVISTDFGERGNAHSEYLGPLSEQGFLGMAIFISILILSMYYGINLIQKTTGQEQILLYGATLGLATYFIHGFLNNFLDTDKASCLFWGYLAFITLSDLRNKTEKSIKLDTQHGDVIEN